MPFKGIFGLSLKKASLFNKFVLKNKIFSFYLTQNENKFILGDIRLKNTYYNFVDITKESTEFDLWKIELEHFTIGNIDFCKTYRDKNQK
jgi:hypothetical protein